MQFAFLMERPTNEEHNRWERVPESNWPYTPMRTINEARDRIQRLFPQQAKFSAVVLVAVPKNNNAHIHMNPRLYHNDGEHECVMCSLVRSFGSPTRT